MIQIDEETLFRKLLLAGIRDIRTIEAIARVFMKPKDANIAWRNVQAETGLVLRADGSIVIPSDINTEETQ